MHAFCSVGYDSDDECEESGGMRYTRRNKGKKYAPLRKDDSLEHGAASKVRDRSGFGSNGASISANGRAGSAVNHVNNHRHNSDPRYSSEENASDGEPPSQGSYVRQQAGGISFICPSAQQCCFSLHPLTHFPFFCFAFGFVHMRDIVYLVPVGQGVTREGIESFYFFGLSIMLSMFHPDSPFPCKLFFFF